MPHLSCGLGSIITLVGYVFICQTMGTNLGTGAAQMVAPVPHNGQPLPPQHAA